MYLKEIILTALALAVVLPALAKDKVMEALVYVEGSAFQGGAKDLYGSSFHGERVNYVYAQPTDRHSRMSVKFDLKVVPSEALFIHVKGRDDDGPSQCEIAIELNGRTLFQGSNDFPEKQFAYRRFAIPRDTLVAGENALVIVNREKEGKLGNPPWFQVASFALGGSQYTHIPDVHKDFWVTLGVEKRPFPEPLPEGKAPGYKWRGIKGFMWRPEHYLAEIPLLAKYKLNFLMNCYGSMCDIEHYSWGNPKCNRWWEPLPEKKKKSYEKIVQECQNYHVEFCFSMNPNLCSERFINDDDPQSVDQLYQHYAWMQGLGVRWFNISLDDISKGINASGQARVANEIFRRLRAKDPAAQMIFCPTFYWADGTGKDQQPYLETLALELDKDIYFFWTGDAVVGKVSIKAAQSFRRICGHKLFLWDNYPVNDGAPTMHLGPVIDREPGVEEFFEGYISNPLHNESELGRIPVLTCLDYAWNPYEYDPGRSVSQAILQFANTRPRQEVLKDLVDVYPGMLIYGLGNTGFNAVQDQFRRICVQPHSRFAAQAYIDGMQALAGRLQKEFPTQYQAEKKILDGDIKKMKERFSTQYRDRQWK